MRPSPPVMLYDGDCKFCKRWIQRWAHLTEERVTYLAYQDHLKEFPQVTEEDCRNAVQFIESDGTVYQAAEAVLRTFLYTKSYGWLYRWYKKSKLFASFAELLYKAVAKNRDFLSGIGL